MRGLWRLLKRLILVLVAGVLMLLSPVAYTEVMCRPQGTTQARVMLIDPGLARAESRTLMTYPEWDIVHAYEDYAQVIATGDPQDYGFLRGIGGFWSSLCAVSRESGTMGGVDIPTKQMVYVIGISFTAEFLLKAAYEETLGRLFSLIRGPDRAPLDNVSARQAADYAAFLRQVPWYRWDFHRDAAELDQNATGAPRDRERRLALGLEFRAKAAYARVIAQAVAATGQDELTLRMVLTGVADAQLAATEGVAVITHHPEGTEIVAPRYAALTDLLVTWAGQGADFVEIAGNGRIMFTALSGNPSEEGALFSRARQGFGDYRHILVVPVVDLAEVLRGLSERGLRLEHIHDY